VKRVAFRERPFSGQDVSCRVGWGVGRSLSIDDGLLEDRNMSALCPLTPLLLPLCDIGTATALRVISKALATRGRMCLPALTLCLTWRPFRSIRFSSFVRFVLLRKRRRMRAHSGAIPLWTIGLLPTRGPATFSFRGHYCN
jgi:hypothetical protein